MRRFRCDVLGEGELVLDASESHHLLRVLGVAPDEEVELFDGHGRRQAARFLGPREGLAVLQSLGPPVADQEPEVWLLVALLKHAAFDTVLRMATELGVTHVVPVRASRTVAKGERRDRWERIITGAAKQCGRASVPTLLSPSGLSQALALPAAHLPRWMAVPGAEARHGLPAPCVVLVGPEGGWTRDEVALALEAGVQPLGLGTTVLRADTATAVVLGRIARG